MILRLCANDYHHYCYIDDGFQGRNHFVKGLLHSVQPIALENAPVYRQNRRMWTILDTVNFGKVAQIEIDVYKRQMQDKTQKQVAEVLGRNQVAISRMEKNTLEKLRRAMM